MTDNKKLVEALAELYLHLNQTYGDDNNTYRIQELKVRYRIMHKAWNQDCCYGFVDFDGNIYKAASLSTPAKHIRGNLFKDGWKDCLNRYSVKYLR